MSEIWIPAAAGGGTDLDVVTAQAGDVRNGKVIVGPDGEPLTGTMKEIGAKTYTPGKSNQVIAANQFLAGAQTIAGDADLIPDNILYGKNIFGVNGNVRKYVSKAIGATNTGSGVYNSEVRGYIYPLVINNTGITATIAQAFPSNGQKGASIATGSTNNYISYDSSVWSGSLPNAKLAYNTVTFYVIVPGKYSVTLIGYA